MAYAAAPPYPSQGGVSQPAYEQPVSRIELKVSCRNLIDMDVFSKSDPFVVLYMQAKDKSRWNEIGRTETIMDNLNPDFVKSFIVDYFFEEQQMLKFEVYDLDDKQKDIRNQDFLGKLVTSVGSIVGENCGKLEHNLQTPTAKDKERNDQYSRSSAGTIIVRAEELSENRDVVTFQLIGSKLDKKDFFGKSDPYLEFHRCNEDNSYSVVHRTEVIKNTLNPNWKPFTIPARVLCNGDYDRNLKVYCYDWESSGTPDLIGIFDASLRDFKDYRSGRPTYYELVHPKKKGKKKYKHSGTIHIQECKVEERASFLEYIRGGLVLNFIVAVDFTASNGDPQTPQSLHYSTPHMPCQYVQVLQAIGGILEDYDADKMFPSFGFGAKVPPTWEVKHEFALNFNPQDPDCHGINGIIQAYYHSITNVKLYGPTNFAPIISNCSRIARETPVGSQYYVLLIITDGVISDLDRTKEAIIEAANLPVSIIIVGVGTADFDAMEELDGDDVRVSYRGVQASRDIVQFVPFREYMNGNVYNPAHGDRLARDVLKELPDQVIEHMKKHNFKPGAPPPPYVG